MIFEDDPDQLYILDRVLGRLYTVIASATLKDLATQLRTHRPDLVLIDNKIGLQLAQEVVPMIRKEADLQHLPFILTSGHRDIKELSEQIGAVGYLQKPFSLVKLKQMVERHLSASTVK